MNNKYSLRRIASYACLAVFALFCILMLLFSTLSIDISGLSESDNGFTWMGFDSNIMYNSTWDVGKIPLGILSISQLIFGIAAVGLVCYNFVKGADEKNKKIIIIGLISMILFAIEGIVVKSMYCDSLRSALKDYVSTYSFVPLIIGAILVAGYFLSLKFLPDSPIGQASAQNQAGYNPYQQNPNPYQQNPNPYQQNPNPYQQNPNPYQQNPNPYQQNPNPYQQNPNPYQQNPNPYQQNPNPYQQNPNPYQQPANPAQASGTDNVETLKKYKELLDMGIITPEEFEEKKKQLF